MRGWIAAAVFAAGWAATCVEAARRCEEDGKALEAAQVGLSAGYAAAGPRDGFSAVPRSQTNAIVRASAMVRAALEARGRGFRGSFS